jgi:hypothetical protein
MTLQSETIYAKAVEELRVRLRGALLRPGEEGYDEASRAWNLNAHQHPAVVVLADGAEDVVAAVRFARDVGLGVGVMATGHGVGTPPDGGVLINTSPMRGVRVDPVLRTARAEAGALWKDVIPEAHTYGLATLAGSAPHVGVVGYTMGGLRLARAPVRPQLGERHGGRCGYLGWRTRPRKTRRERGPSMGPQGRWRQFRHSHFPGVPALSARDRLRWQRLLPGPEGPRGAERLRPLERGPPG